MALIKCPECGKDVSDKARSCIHCGCPLEDMVVGGDVRVKIPNNIVEGIVGLFSSRRASVNDANGKLLWEGKHGENAKFFIDKPTQITIDLGGWGNPVSGTVEPKKKYALVQDMGMHMLATFRITEVDIIDSD